MSTVSDVLIENEVLVERILEGDEMAFKILYNRISGKMYSLCLSYAVDSNEANDFFHDGFVKLYRYLHSYRGNGSFEGWTRRIFVTTCLDNVKKRRYWLNDVESLEDISAGETEINKKISLAGLMEIIRKLPPAYNEMVNLFIVEDYSHREIATMLGISESASKSKLQKARAHLKKMLTQGIGNG